MDKSRFAEKNINYTRTSASNDIERLVVKPSSGPKEMHVILWDNGRRDMLADNDFREALTCIRCEAYLFFVHCGTSLERDLVYTHTMGGFGVV